MSSYSCDVAKEKGLFGSHSNYITRKVNLFTEKRDFNTRTPWKFQVVPNTRRRSSIKHQTVCNLEKYANQCRNFLMQGQVLPSIKSFHVSYLVRKSGCKLKGDLYNLYKQSKQQILGWLQRQGIGCHNQILSGFT